MARRLWSEADAAQFIVDCEAGMGTEALIKKYKRSKRAIFARRWIIKAVPPGRYTRREDAIIKRHYDKKSVAEIGEMINRTDAAIRYRCQVLGLDLRRKSKAYKTEDVFVDQDFVEDVYIMLKCGYTPEKAAYQKRMTLIAFKELIEKHHITEEGRDLTEFVPYVVKA